MNADEPAFPFEHCTGLTKREEFAKAAMQGILANPEYRGDVVDYAICKADEMLAELEKEEKNT